VLAADLSIASGSRQEGAVHAQCFHDVNLAAYGRFFALQVTEAFTMLAIARLWSVWPDTGLLECPHREHRIPGTTAPEGEKTLLQIAIESNPKNPPRRAELRGVPLP